MTVELQRLALDLRDRDRGRFFAYNWLDGRIELAIADNRGGLASFTLDEAALYALADWLARQAEALAELTDSPPPG